MQHVGLQNRSPCATDCSKVRSAQDLTGDTACLNTLFNINEKASSTFKFDSALISLKGSSRFLANNSPLSLVTSLRFSRSHLFATSIFVTSGLASSSVFRIHLGMFRNDFSSVTSYTSIMPCAPR